MRNLPHPTSDLSVDLRRQRPTPGGFFLKSLDGAISDVSKSLPHACPNGENSKTPSTLLDSSPSLTGPD